MQDNLDQMNVFCASSAKSLKPQTLKLRYTEYSMPSNAAGRVFQFGVFELNEATGELRKRGVRIKLHAQPFQVLRMLLERPNDIVTREDMRQRLWGGETFVDFEHGLNTAVNKIRAALGDSASQPRYIETVPGRGYRFLISVAVRVPAVTQESSPAVQESIEAQHDEWTGTVLTATHELPAAPRKLVRILLMLVQLMYLSFYFGALANLQEIHEIFLDANLLPSPGILMALVVTTGSILIPVRLFLLTAAGFNFSQLPQKFRKLFPGLFVLDMLWALSPLLLIHHIPFGLALGASAALVYMPFAQRSLILMYARAK